MSITAIEIVKNNVTANCDLISIHQPIVFLANVSYTGDIPMNVYVQLRSPNESGDYEIVGNFKALPYKDIDPLTRQYAFVADGILRTLMSDFKDFESEEKTLEYCEGFTNEFELYFQDRLDDVPEIILDSCSFIACHASQQFGDDVQMLGIQNNTQNIIYYGGANRMVYVYVYNNNESNDLRILNASEYLVDFDDVPFIDSELYLTSE